MLPLDRWRIIQVRLYFVYMPTFTSLITGFINKNVFSEMLTAKVRDVPPENKRATSLTKLCMSALLCFLCFKRLLVRTHLYRVTMLQKAFFIRSFQFAEATFNMADGHKIHLQRLHCLGLSNAALSISHRRPKLQKSDNTGICMEIYAITLRK